MTPVLDTSPALVKCPKCRAALEPENLSLQHSTICPGCKTRLFGIVFSSLYHPQTPDTNPAATFTPTEKTTCYYHQSRKAEIVCAGCGRFICALCDMEIEETHLCPPCFEAARRKNHFPTLGNYCVLHDKMALALAIVPFFVTAIAALFLVFRHWNSPRRPVGRPKARFMAAAILAILQLSGWIAIIALAAAG